MKRLIPLLLLSVLTIVGCGVDDSSSNTSAIINRDNFDTIENGMSQKEVENILGPGTPVEVDQSRHPGQEHYYWQTTDAVSHILVQFKDGKVVAKTAGGLEPPL